MLRKINSKLDNLKLLTEAKQLKYDNLVQIVDSADIFMEIKITLCINAITQNTKLGKTFFESRAFFPSFGSIAQPRLTSGTLRKIIVLIKEKIIPNIVILFDAKLLVEKLNNINMETLYKDQESKHIINQLKKSAKTKLSELQQQENFEFLELRQEQFVIDLTNLVASNDSIETKILDCCDGVNPKGAFGSVLYSVVSGSVDHLSQFQETHWERAVRLINEDIIPNIANLSDAELLVETLNSIQVNLFANEPERENIFEQLKENANEKLNELIDSAKYSEIIKLSDYFQILDQNMSKRTSGGEYPLIEDMNEKVDDAHMSTREKLIYYCQFIRKNEILLSYCNQEKLKGNSIDGILQIIPESGNFKTQSMGIFNVFANKIARESISIINEKLISKTNCIKDVELLNVELNKIKKMSVIESESSRLIGELIEKAIAKKIDLVAKETNLYNKLKDLLISHINRKDNNEENIEIESLKLVNKEITLYWQYAFENLVKNFQKEKLLSSLLNDLNDVFSQNKESDIFDATKFANEIKDISKKISDYISAEENGVGVFSKEVRKDFSIINELSEHEIDIFSIRNIFYCALGGPTITEDELGITLAEDSQSNTSRLQDNIKAQNLEGDNHFINSRESEKSRSNHANIVSIEEENINFDSAKIKKSDSEQYDFFGNDFSNIIDGNEKLPINIGDDMEIDNEEDFQEKNNEDDAFFSDDEDSKYALIEKRYPYYYYNNLPRKVTYNQKKNQVDLLKEKVKELEEEKHQVTDEIINMFLDAINPYGRTGVILFTPTTDLMSEATVLITSFLGNSKGKEDLLPTLESDEHLKQVVALFMKMIKKITDTGTILELFNSLLQDIAFYEKMDPQNWSDATKNRVPFFQIIDIAKRQWAHLKALPKGRKRTEVEMAAQREMYGKRSKEEEWGPYQEFEKIYYTDEFNSALDKISSYLRQKFSNSPPVKKQAFSSVEDNYQALCGIFRRLDISNKINQCGIFLEEAFRDETEAFELNLICKYINEELRVELADKDNIQCFLDTLNNINKIFSNEKGALAKNADLYLEKLKCILVFFKFKRECLILLDSERAANLDGKSIIKMQKDGVNYCWKYFHSMIMKDMELLMKTDTVTLEDAQGVISLLSRLNDASSFYLVHANDEIKIIKNIHARHSNENENSSAQKLFSARLEQVKNFLEKIHGIGENTLIEEEFTLELRNVLYNDIFQIEVPRIPRPSPTIAIPQGSSNNNLGSSSRFQYGRAASLPTEGRFQPGHNQQASWVMPAYTPRQMTNKN